jgi:hypothetical protein
LLEQLVREDPAYVRVHRDLVVALVRLGDVVRATDAERARDLWRRARDLAVALQSTAPDARVDRDLDGIRARLSAAAGEPPWLALLAMVNGRAQPLQAGYGVPRGTTHLLARTRVPDGWAQYLVVFGAAGEARILDEGELRRSGWQVPLTGPPPAQSVLLLAQPTQLSAPERQRLAEAIGRVAGPRIIDVDSHLVWSSEDDVRIESVAAARGGLRTHPRGGPRRYVRRFAPCQA